MAEIDLDLPFVIDTPASTRFAIYTRANAVDAWPGVLSPLNATTQTAFEFDLAWRRALARFGAFDVEEFDEKIPELMGNFYGYTYLNLSVQRVFGVRMPGLDADTMTSAFLGSAEGVPPYEPDHRDESAGCTARIGETIGWVLSAESLPTLDEQRHETERLVADRPDLTALSNHELVRYATPFVTSAIYPLLEELLFVTSAGSVPIGMVQAATAALGEPGLAMRLLSGLGGVDSAVPTLDLWDLGRLVSASSSLCAAFDGGTGELLARLRTSDTDDARDFLQRFDNFLSRHGYRCSNEYDLGECDWASNPSLPLTMIERMRFQADAASPRAAAERLAAERRALTTEVAAKLASDPEAQGSFLAAVRAASVFLPGRERAKATVVMIMQPARHALQELGRRMVTEGHFRQVDDFTMLRLDEFDAFLDDPAKWAQEIDRRRRWSEELDVLEPPFIFVGKPTPPSTWKRREVREYAPVTAGEVIVGASGCQGVATGIARVLSSPSDGGDLEPGEVLVTIATDPGWTPLFVSAVAVVVDTGSALSHAAIVSRELGVPCVISAPNASRRIPDGARITVDGTTGVVTILSVP